MRSDRQDINTNELITSLMKNMDYEVDGAVCAELVMAGRRAFL